MGEKDPGAMGDYSATGQPSGYVNPAYPSTDLPPNYVQTQPAYGQPAQPTYGQPQPAYGQPQPVYGQPAQPPPYGQPVQAFTMTTAVVQHPGVVIREQNESQKAKQLGMGGAILACIVCLLLVVGMSTNHWGRTGDLHYGLWKFCFKGICLPTVFGAFLHPIWWAIQGFCVIGTVLVIIGVILHCVMGFTHARNKRSLGVGAIVMYSIAIFFLVVAVGLFGAFTFSPIVKSWSFYLTVVALVGCIVLAILAGLARGEHNARGAVIQSQPVTVATIS